MESTELYSFSCPMSAQVVEIYCYTCTQLNTLSTVHTKCSRELIISQQ